VAGADEGDAARPYLVPECVGGPEGVMMCFVGETALLPKRSLTTLPLLWGAL